MKIKAYLKFAKSLVFPKSERQSSAGKSMRGAVLCIAISLVPLIMVSSISSGLIGGMTERIIGLSSSHIQAYVARDPSVMGDAQTFIDFASSIAEEDGVVQVFPEINSSALASANGYRTGIQIRAIPADIFSQNESFKTLFKTVSGNISDFTDDSKMCVIGEKLSELISVGPGDSFSVITTKNLNGKITPRLTRLTVAAIVSSGYQELDSLWVFVPLDTGYKFLPLKSSVFNIMIETPDAFSPSLMQIKTQLQYLFGEYANFYSWDEVNSAQFENFSSTRVMLLFVMILIVLVACINISSALVMLVMERRKEIAVLKSVGATNKGITFSFVIAGLSLGAMGVLFGVPAGLLLSLFSNQIIMAMEKTVNFVSYLISFFRGSVADFSTLHLMDPAYYMSEIPVVIPWGDVVLVVFSAIILSILVSFIPSYKAGKEKTLDLLNGE